MCLLLFCCAPLGALPIAPTAGSGGPAGAGQDDLTVQMEPYQGKRPGLFFQEKLVKRGSVTMAGKKYTLYLPAAKTYSLKNSPGKRDHIFENTSTRLAVDQNGDGKLTETDSWFANLPIRLGDKMFDVTEIAADGSRIVLKPSRSPLSGVVIGRTCPPFSFKTADGKTISRDSLAGKAFLLDIWSIT
jgi:hypothetical protein